MGSYIIKLEDSYLYWSSVSDGPSFGMTLEELREDYREEHGRAGMRELDERLRRVEEKGTSGYDDENADDTIWLNRAGPDEERLSREEIIEFYVRRREDPTHEALDAFRRARGLVPCPIETCPDSRGVRDSGSRCHDCWGTGWKSQSRSEERSRPKPR